MTMTMTMASHIKNRMRTGRTRYPVADPHPRLIKEIQAHAAARRKPELLFFLRGSAPPRGLFPPRIGIGPSAISMMLNRQYGPQRRTIEKLAKALKVPVADIWPVAA